MGVIIRQSIKGSIATYIGIAIGALNTLILFPYLLTPEEIGILETFRGYAMLFGPFILLGTPQMIFRFFPEFNNSKKELNGFMGMIISIAMLGFGAFVSIWIFSGPSFASLTSDMMLIKYSMILYCLIFYLSFFTILYTYSSILQRITVPNILQNVILRGAILIVIFFYSLNLFDFDKLLFWFVQVHSIPLILIVVYIYYHRGSFLNISSQMYNKKNLQALSTFGLFMLMGTASSVIINKIDIIMVGSMTKNIGKAGIYSLSFYIGSIIEIPKRSLSMMVVPIISSAFKENDMAKIENIYKKTAINQFIAAIILFGSIWLNIDLIFHIMPNGQIYETGKYVVLFIALGKTIDMLMGCNIEIISVSKYYKFSLFASIFLAVLTVTTNYIFIQIFDFTGAAIASIITLIIYNLANYLFIYYKFKISPFNKNIFLIFIIGSLCFLICLLLPDTGNIFFDSIIASGLFTILLSYMIYRYKISEDFNTVILNCLKFLKII